MKKEKNNTKKKSAFHGRKSNLLIKKMKAREIERGNTFNGYQI